MIDLARKTIDGATVNVSVTLFKTVLQFVVVLPILAREISPMQFGLVGMAMAFVTFFTMFNDLGISAALVREDKPSPAFWSSAFWTNFAIGTMLTCLSYLAAPWIAAFFTEPIVEPLVEALSLVLLMHCLFLVPMAWLQRNFKFVTIATIDLSATILSAASAIWAAFQGYGVWALVIQQLVMFGVKMVGGLASQRAPLRLVYDSSEIIRVLPFSLRLTGTAFVGFLNRNTDNILIGRFLGAESLGFYGRAYQIMLVPVHSISTGAGFALYPAMSAIKDDVARLANVYLKAQSVLTAITLPMMTGLALVSTPFVALVFGPKWHAVAPVLTFLSFAGVVQALTGTSNVLWKALGQSEVLLRWSIIRMVGFVSAFIIGIWMGSIANLAAVYLLANLILFAPFQLGTLRRIGLPARDFIRSVTPCVISTAIMAIVLMGLKWSLPEIESWRALNQLGLLVPAGIVSYVLAMTLLFRSYLKSLLGEAKDLFVRKARPA
ncbi:MAG: lipopolysaccharide biosynthesis protein [Pseudomonadota bacterium]